MSDRIDELLTGDIGKQQKKPFTEDRVLRLLTGEGLEMIESPIPGEEGNPHPQAASNFSLMLGSATAWYPV